MNRKRDVLDCLRWIDPSELDYQEWINVGMGLKEAGYTATVWDEWSSTDLGRYKRGECMRKWESFRSDTASKITGGTIIKMARDRGWTPVADVKEIQWNEAIEKDGTARDSAGEKKLLRIPEQWDPAAQLITYLETLFSSDEKVGYVTKCWSQKDGKKDMPSKGCWDRTAGQLIQALSKCNGDIGAVLGDYNPNVGAWIRFNPLDGAGIRNENVTEYRFALVESDTLPIEKQYELLRQLELPIACLVHSGGKSLHAIVRIEAVNYEEYRKRVDFLYDACRRSGLDVDPQNRNPSRLSRMPGVLRKGNKQYLLGTNLGKPSFREWKQWCENSIDNLPEPESLADVWDCMPDLAEPLIEGILRKGHKLLLAGPSKAGKSFALIELCCAIAEGKPWLGRACSQGRVLYVNLELDKASCFHRFKEVYGALGWPANHLANIDIWNLRGKSVPMDQLAPKLIRRATNKEYVAVVIDPIYKVITGDENSADQMANFCNQFDKVCSELGCAVIYCHHHSKGAQGGKRAMDRASGSGVFARDPDALLDMIELPISSELREQEADRAVYAACAQVLDQQAPAWRAGRGPEGPVNARTIQETCETLLCEEGLLRARTAYLAAMETSRRKTAWRISGTLREFPAINPMDLWFEYPVHKRDELGVLQDIVPENESSVLAARTRTAAGAKKTPEQQRKDKLEALDRAYDVLSADGEVTLSKLMGYLGISKNTLRDRIDASGCFIRDGGVVKRA